MTNEIAIVTYFTVVQTNWTGYSFQGQELGVVITNEFRDVSSIQFHSEEKIEVYKSNIAVWRPDVYWDKRTYVNREPLELLPDDRGATNTCPK